jgi:CDP-6-deoxy-D-xylo-4-hexulose-3-dehydrase
MSAAFALVQLADLEKNIEIRLRNYSVLAESLSAYPDMIRLFTSNAFTRTNWLAFPLVLQGDLSGCRKELQLYLEDNGIQTRTIFTGNILRHPAMSDVDRIGEIEDFPNADEVMKNGILLGCHSRLSIEQVAYMGKTIASFIDKQ